MCLSPQNLVIVFEFVMVDETDILQSLENYTSQFRDLIIAEPLNAPFDSVVPVENANESAIFGMWTSFFAVALC